MDTQQKFDSYIDLYFDPNLGPRGLDDLDEELNDDPALQEIWDATLKENWAPTPIEFAKWAVEQSKYYWGGDPISPELMVDVLQVYYDESPPLCGGVIEIMKYGWNKENLKSVYWEEVLDFAELLLEDEDED